MKNMNESLYSNNTILTNKNTKGQSIRRGKNLLKK